MKKFYWLSLAVAGAMSGCGGGGSNDESREIQVGSTEQVEIRSDDVLVAQETYEYREISRAGALSASALPAGDGTGELLAIQTKGDYAASWKAGFEPVPDANAFFSLLWSAVSAHYQGKLTPEQLVAQFQDLDGSLEEIYQSFISSGLSMQDYVGLFELLDTYFDDEYDEALLRLFFGLQGIKASEFLTVLQQSGGTPQSFFAQMKADGVGMKDLAPYFEQWQTTQSSQSLPTLKAANALTVAALPPGSSWNGELPVSAGPAIEYAWKQLKSLLGSIVSKLGEIVKLAKGTYAVQPFAWDPQIPNISGGSPISSNELHFKSSLGKGFASVTLYEFKVKLNAVVGAKAPSEWLHPVIRSLSLDVSSKKARPGNAWGLGMGAVTLDRSKFDACTPYQAGCEQLSPQIVGVMGAAVIQSGIKNRNYLFQSVLTGYAPTKDAPFMLSACSVGKSQLEQAFKPENMGKDFCGSK